MHQGGKTTAPIQLHSHWCSPPAWNTTKAGLQQQQDMVEELLGTGGCTGAMLRAGNLVLVLVITSRIHGVLFPRLQP